MPTRRDFLSALAGTGAASLAGCLQFVDEEGPITATSSPAVFGEDAVIETNYEFRDLYTNGVDDDFRIQGEDRRVAFNLWKANYERVQQFDGLVSHVEGLSTPDVEVDGESVNPLAQADPERLAEFLSQEFANISLGEVVDEAKVMPFDEEESIQNYQARVAFNEGEFGAQFVLMQTRHESDAITVMGIYSQFASNDQFDEITRLADSLRHPVDPESVDTPISGNR